MTQPPSYPGPDSSDGSQQPPPPGGPVGPIGGGQPAGTSQMAVWSLVTGIVGLICGFIGACGVLFGPVGIGLGVAARRQIDESRGAKTGSGMALAGIITGAIGAVISIIWIILFATGAIDVNWYTES